MLRAARARARWYGTTTEAGETSGGRREWRCRGGSGGSVRTSQHSHGGGQRPGQGWGHGKHTKVKRAVSETIVRETILNRVRGSLLTKRCVPVSHVAIPFVLQWVYISYILICSSSPCNADRNIGRRHVCRVDQRRAPVRRLDALERLARRDVATFKTFKTFKTSRPSCPNQQGSA